jgi:Glycine-rich domain
MARRCGCASDVCSCTIVDGTGTTVSGVGSKTNPYKVDVVGSGVDVEDENVVVVDGATSINFTGAGVTAAAGAAGEAVVTIPGGGGAGGGIAGVKAIAQIFTAGGSWTKLGSLLYVQVQLVGGGGGSGGNPATNASSQACSAGGGGGGYVSMIIQAADLLASETVTVGAGGAAGNGNNPGGTGGTSSFGSHCSATGGSGGAQGIPSATTQATIGGAGGSGFDADLIIPGQYGGFGQVLLGERTYQAHGGDSQLGKGGRPGRLDAGGPGLAYGGGGGGSTSNQSDAARPGAVGAPGIVIVTAYVTI